MARLTSSLPHRVFVCRISEYEGQYPCVPIPEIKKIKHTLRDDDWIQKFGFISVNKIRKRHSH